jgi:peroxiredoxin
MRIFLPLILLSLGYFGQAQHTISGTFYPAKDYSWLIAYRMKPGTQAYVTDTSIKNGKFVLKIPENAPASTYRLVYAVPQEEFYFDVIYNGKEDIKLSFETHVGVSFITSNENIPYSTYFNEINDLQQQLTDFYASGNSKATALLEISEKLTATQKLYEEKSKDLLAHEFIWANRPYIPTGNESIQEYVANRKKKYFERIDFKNLLLQASEFLTDKIANYIFTALPLEQISQLETEKVVQENIMTVSAKLEEVGDTYKFHVYYSLWRQAAASGFNDTSDFIYSNYLKTLATATNNQNIISDIEIHNRLRIGAKAPELSWKKGNGVKKLGDLEGFTNYLVIFWSSTCSHCLKELPALHKELRNNEAVQVIAVGLEDEEVTWKLASEKLSDFEHAIALGKWESNYAKLYDIHATPTYFILNSDKKIIDKPESDRDVVEFFKK